MRVSPIAAGLCVLVGAVTLGANDFRSILWEESGPFKHVDDNPAHRFSQQLLIHERNRLRVASAPHAVSEDVGDVAVVVDNGSILIPAADPNPFDLALPTNIVWTPAANGFGVAFAAPSVDPSVGSALPLEDDDTENVALPFSFPFLGTSYASIFVNSDGNITLGSGDSASTLRDAARLIGGPPRIAPLLNDLNPSAGGTVNARVAADRAVITWTDVPEFGTTNANTFQVTLQSNGTITFAYSQIQTDFGAMVIGVAEGNNQGPLNEIDLTASLPGTFDAGAVFEEFAPGHGALVDILELSQEFYRTHSDKYDFLVVFTDFNVDLQGAFAFNFTLKNATRGIGWEFLAPGGQFDFSAIAGSGGELESFVMMNRIGLYWPDESKLVDPPIKKFRFFGGASFLGPPGQDQISRRARWFGTLNGDFGAHGSYTLGLNSAMSIMGQEAGHRWLAYVPFVHPTKGISFDSLDLLGRSFQHWSFFFNVRVPSAQFAGDPRASSAEGNAIVDFGGNIFGDCRNPGETRFRTERNELIDGYTELDQYLMGLRRSNEVGAFWYVDEPTRPGSGTSFEDFRSVGAIDDVGICGKRVNLTVANIQAFPGIGPRVPEIGDEIDRDAAGNPQTDVKTMAFILLVQQGPPKSPAHASAISQVDNFRGTWQTYSNGPATGGRGRFDTSLNPAIH